jgi:hypothetical protein
MRNTKPITVTMALAALVIFASISFSGASQAMTTHGVKVKHKHALVKHKIKGKQEASPQTLAKPEMEGEHEGIPVSDSMWFWRHRDLITGTIPDGLVTSWYKSDQANALLRDGHDGILSTGDPIDTVACLGPFNQGGRTRALLVSAADLSNNTFFAGGTTGGLWKSTNAGGNWTPVNDTAANLNVVCITQSPFNSNNIYYGTGELATNDGQHGQGVAVPGAGVFKSTDGGNTFQQLSATASIQYSWAIEYDKADSNTVYYATVNSGLQRTTNGGNTWSMAPGTAAPEVCDIVTFPNGSVLIAKVDSGLYFASNGKTGSYTKISSTAFPSSSFTRIKLAQCENFPNTVYAAFTNYTDGLGLARLCKSTDGGVTWDTVHNPSYLGWMGPAGTGGYHMMLGVRPTNGNFVTCGLVSGVFSTDGGTTWAGMLLPHQDWHAYAPYNSGSGYFLVGTDGGVALFNWDSLVWPGMYTPLNNNYITTQFVGGGFASSGRRCVGGTQDNGAWRFRPSDIYGGGGAGNDDNTYCYISQQDTNLAYVGGYDGGIIKYPQYFTGTPHSGAESINPPIGSQGTEFYNFFQSNYADPLQLYFRTNQGIWRTIDTGHSWAELNSATISGIDYIGCTPIANPNVYFTTSVSGQNSHFYRISAAKTFAPGGTPTDLSASIPSAVQTASFGEIAPLPGLSISNTLYMCTTNYSSIPHIYKVKNANTTTPIWENLTGSGLPSTIAVNEVQADPNDTNVLFAATDYGLYYSTNNGTNWIKEPRVPNTIIYEMQLRASDNKLFLFTYGRGVWYCSIKSGLTGSVEQASVAPAQPTEEFQFSIYPTPATSKLNITLKDDLSSSARMVIYDMTGHMVSQNLWNAGAGENQEADISKLASGVYFLQIQDGDKSSTQKFEKM